MNIASRIIITSFVIALCACGKSTQEDVDNAAHDRAAGVAKAQEGAQPAVDAANRELAKAKQEGDAKVADASAAANREVDKAEVKQFTQQAKADYDVAIAAADGDLTVAIEKCKMAKGDAEATCEQDAHLTHDQAVNSAKARLDSASQKDG